MVGQVGSLRTHPPAGLERQKWTLAATQWLKANPSDDQWTLLFADALPHLAEPVPLDPEDSPGFLLWHLTLRWQREIAAALTPLGLTHVQFVLLAAAWWLNSRGEDPNQLSVARQAGTDVKMTSEVLRKLEAKGLIVRTVDAADTRARRIRVTERGGELAMAAVTAVEGVDTAFFRAVPDPAALLAMLRTLAQGGG